MNGHAREQSCCRYSQAFRLPFPTSSTSSLQGWSTMPKIKQLTGLEILDSRGRPTVQATCTLASGVRATVSVPSGASTGAAEARELRDGDPARYRGLGCRKAVAHVG